MVARVCSPAALGRPGLPGWTRATRSRYLASAFRFTMRSISLRISPENGPTNSQ